MPTKTFYHSGDLGDIIYALPTVRGLGGGTLYLGPDNRSGMQTREPMTDARCALIAPLIEAQSYITSCEFRYSTNGVDVNLNDFRLNMYGGKQLDCEPGFNLARVPLKHFGLSVESDQQPWLAVEKDMKVPRVLVSRSPRYNTPNFDWRRILEEYRNELAFVGLHFEYENFCKAFGRIPHYPTHNLLDLAKAIAGCELFIGNQSCPYAIAVGLGVDAVLEKFDPAPNCLFQRPNIIVGCTAETELPKINRRPVIPITAPVENFTGYGQVVNALCEGFLKQNREFLIHPFAYDDNKAKIYEGIKHRISRGEFRNGLLICSILEVPMRLKPGQILFTMWEATRIAPEIVQAINLKAKCVIVPSAWNAACFGASGVNVPMRIVPLGIDPTQYQFRPVPLDQVFRFGTAGRLAHAGCRKGIEETVDCFLKAFPTNPNVEMTVKIFEDCKFAVTADPRIKVVRAYLKPDEMIQWYESLDCFVSMTKGEGWGLHIHQAMSIGRAVIAPNYSGQSAFMREDTAYCCRYRLEAPTWSVYQNQGQWCVPDSKHVIELMRLAESSRQATINLGARASESVRHLTNDNMTTQVLSVLNEFQ